MDKWNGMGDLDATVAQHRDRRGFWQRPGRGRLNGSCTDVLGLYVHELLGRARRARFLSGAERQADPAPSKTASGPAADGDDVVPF
jgi:hypothetical protein